MLSASTYAYEHEFKYCCLGYIPKFLNALNGDFIHTIVVKGDKVHLKCDAVGMPEPKIVWKKHGFRVAGNDNTFVQLSGNELIFLHVNETDTGWYTCEAGNYLGIIQRSYQLTVHGKISFLFFLAVVLNDSSYYLFSIVSTNCTL